MARAEPVAFIDLTTSPVVKAPQQTLLDQYLSQPGPARRAAPSVLGKRERPALDNTSNKGARKSTAHSHNTTRTFMSDGSAAQEDGGGSALATASPQPFGASAISAYLDELLDVQYAHEIHLTHLENEVVLDFKLRARGSVG